MYNAWRLTGKPPRRWSRARSRLTMMRSSPFKSWCRLSIPRSPLACSIPWTTRSGTRCRSGCCPMATYVQSRSRRRRPLGLPAALLAGLSLAVGARIVRHRHGQLALFHRPQPVFAARAKLNPSLAKVYAIPVGQKDRPVLEIDVRWVNPNHPREPLAPPRSWARSGGQSKNGAGDGGRPELVDVELIGIPAHDHWCAVRHVETRSLGIPTDVAFWFR